MRSIELFAGAGGLALGLERAGFRPELVVEWDNDCYETLQHNKVRRVCGMANWPIIKADVRSLDYSTYRNQIDVLAGGPPCQPFSIAGKHGGHTDRRDMWPEAIRAVREIEPRAFLFENVRGLMRPAFHDYLQYIVLQLSMPATVIAKNELWPEHFKRLSQKQRSGRSHTDLHYKVHVHQIDAVDYGVAQRRRRIIIVGIRSDQHGEWSLPPSTHSREALLWDQWISEEYWGRHHIRVRHRPKPSDAEKKLATQLQTLYGKPQQAPWLTVRDVICDLGRPLLNKEAFQNHRLWPGARLYQGHTGSKYDEPAKTLKAGDHGVPGGENTLVLSNGRARYFTVREAARLQGFPDEFIFPVSWTESMRQLGNAVPVPLAMTFGERLSVALSRRIESWAGERTSRTIGQLDRSCIVRCKDSAYHIQP